MLCGLLSLSVYTAASRAAIALTVLSNDPYTNTTSFHQAEVEPASFASGSTVVTAFQAGRFPDGGSSNIGFATSANGGSTWKNGFLPGTTVYAKPAGPYQAVSDEAVAFDAKHGVWQIIMDGLDSDSVGVAVLVSRSTDGGNTWNSPVTVSAGTNDQDRDKTWIVCDNNAALAVLRQLLRRVGRHGPQPAAAHGRIPRTAAPPGRSRRCPPRRR